jgi:hypothetical protein
MSSHGEGTWTTQCIDNKELHVWYTRYEQSEGSNVSTENYKDDKKWMRRYNEMIQLLHILFDIIVLQQWLVEISPLFEDGVM